MPKFCGHCGSKLENNAKFCGLCGMQLNETLEKNDEENVITSTKKQNRKKILFFVIPIILILIVLGIMLVRDFSEPCTYCGDTPTKGYKVEGTSEKQYYCSDCSSRCAFCSDKAMNHYSSGFGVMVFVCDDCYGSVQSVQDWF